MNRLKIAQYIALGATILMIIGFCLSLANIQLGETIMGMSVLIGWGSYIFGGLFTAIKIACRIAKWGWIVTNFPYDIFTFMMSFVLAIGLFIFVPIIPVRMAYKEKFAY